MKDERLAVPCLILLLIVSRTTHTFDIILASRDIVRSYTYVIYQYQSYYRILAS